jgi:hypothetical protein
MDGVFRVGCVDVDWSHVTYDFAVWVYCEHVNAGLNKFSKNLGAI